MSRMKVFPSQNVQERFSIRKPRVITNKGQMSFLSLVANP